MFTSSSQLETLKNIAEMLNESTQKEVIDKVLDAFISMTHFEAGWIFLEENEHVELASDVGLPTALKHNEKELMCGEDCHCVTRYKKRTLTKATNVIACKRIEMALERGIHDTAGITHHATVPLQTPKRFFGLLNVAASDQKQYTEDLELLEAVAFQLGTALERIERFESEEKRNSLLTLSHSFVKDIQQAHDVVSLHQKVDQGLKQLFHLNALHWEKKAVKHTGLGGWIADFHYIHLTRDFAFSNQESDIFELIIEYIDVSWKQLLIREKEKDMARREERAILAQDLHDSVNQLLFSIALTSKGASKLANGYRLLNEQIQYIEQLSSQALQEMRTLIANQKGERLSAGVFAELRQYARTIGVEMDGTSEGTTTLPYPIEEALLRIGQEALHNVKKHAQVDRAILKLIKGKNNVELSIIDHGKGFLRKDIEHKFSYGLTGMEERVARYHGRIQIESEEGEGTKIQIVLPIEGM